MPGPDDHLTFEFNGEPSGIILLEIVSTKDVVTVFVVGDSTVGA